MKKDTYADEKKDVPADKQKKHTYKRKKKVHADEKNTSL